MKRICIHWTAGPYTMTTPDWEHYHFTVGAKGEIAHGKHPPESNIPPLSNGKYAAHCGGGNSYTIGVSLRGMAGYRGPGQVGRFPLTAEQCEAAWAFVAKLCHQYGIAVTPDTVYTHYEFGRKNPESDSVGKIDITHLPHEPNLSAEKVGDYIRRKVSWYLNSPQKS